jgi:NAD(P)-dependent dehydrogenase (short-subunit alcohol dehydrogenase family)
LSGLKYKYNIEVTLQPHFLRISLKSTTNMVNIKDVRASNSSFDASKESLVAVFVGATAGIGMGTLRQFAKHAYKPKIYIVGRSKSAAKPLLDELTTSNPQGTFVFLETEISLMKKVDDVCEEIKAKEKKLDLLFMSPGYLSFEGRNGKEPRRQESAFANTTYRKLGRH